MKEKQGIREDIKNEILNKNLEISGEDFERPWGGFFKIENGSLKKFMSDYFSGVELPFDVTTVNVSPKILVVAPGKKLSWQVHERRSELWRVVRGPVGLFRSDTDVHPEKMEIHDSGELIELKLGTRHRLVGMDDWGTVAEIWVHADRNNLSDEDDIRRIEDDFGR